MAIRDLGGGLTFDEEREGPNAPRRQFRAEEIDKACSSCGRITAGPHAGDQVDPRLLEHANTYKGSPISHGSCEDCANRQISEARERKAQQQGNGRTHLWWRKIGGGSSGNS